MSQDIGALLASAKQHFDELTRLAPIEQLSQGDFGANASRSRVEELLQKLTSIITKVQRSLSEHLADTAHAPIVILSSGHLAFYRSTLEPNAQTLHDAYWQVSGLKELLGDFPTSSNDKLRKTPVANALSWGVERWIDMVDENEKYDWLDRGFDLDAAFDFAQEPLFQPDDWLENRRLLHPVLIDKPTSKIRDHIRYRLSEIYRAFTFGLWMATVTLCRSVIEFTIKDSASRLGIELTRPNARGVSEDKRLAELVSDVAEKIPTLKDHLETVRDTANRVLHPKKRDVIALPRVLRDEALRCVQSTKKAVEALHSNA